MKVKDNLKIPARGKIAVFATWMVIASAQTILAQTANMDAALASMVALYNSGADPFSPRPYPGLSIQVSYRSLVQRDAQARVLVEVYLNGTQSLESVRQALVAAGAAISGENRDYVPGAFSAYVPFGAVEGLARAAGIGAITLSYRPALHVGKVTSQGAAVIRSNVANASGFTGTGVTVAVLSDSYDTSPLSFTMIREPTDQGSLDLPVLKYKADLAASNTNTDEGRAMMQIVHDVAPGASLCFATAFTGEAGFAANIKALRTGTCKADVIVDDVSYYSEPFFSDGQIAQAVNDVVNSTLLPGKRVAYFSSAGNQQSQGFHAGTAVFASPGSVPGINLLSIPTCAVIGNAASVHNTAGGFLDFGGGVYTKPVMFSNTGGTLVLQWDDPFDKIPNGITTDLNILLFSGGNCAYAIGSDNFAMNRAIELAQAMGSATLMIARTNGGTKLASRVKLVGYGVSLGGSPSVPVTYGHSAAVGAISVAAYLFSNNYLTGPPVFEPFSSPGPVTIAFDKNKNRLSVPETRKKPDIAAPDGVDTTFFPPGNFPPDLTPADPNFFGTSAAAPHAAGVAALMLEKGAGTSYTPNAIKSILQSSAPARVLPYGGGAPVKGYSPYDGFGLIDAVNALDKIFPPVPCPAVPVGQPSPC